MAGAKFKLNHPGMAALLKSPGIAGDMMRRAEQAAAAARSSAPVETGAYQASIHTEAAVTDRAVARVVADVDYSLVVEAKTRNLGRSLDAAGG